jgi:hypothetical protein
MLLLVRLFLQPNGKNLFPVSKLFMQIVTSRISQTACCEKDYHRHIKCLIVGNIASDISWLGEPNQESYHQYSTEVY